jgi:hypothetical protein
MTKIDTSVQVGWLKALENLPERQKGKGPIPAFFFVRFHLMMISFPRYNTFFDSYCSHSIFELRILNNNGRHMDAS